MGANLKVGKAIKALANLTTPFAPQNPFAPWGVARRRNACSLSFFLSALKKSEKILLKLIFFVLLHQLEKSELKNAEEE